MAILRTKFKENGLYNAGTICQKLEIYQILFRVLHAKKYGNKNMKIT